MVIDLAAWYLFRTAAGELWACSSAIFFIGRPGDYKLKEGRADLHDDVPTGLLWDGQPPNAAVVAELGFPILPPGVYGYPLNIPARGSVPTNLVQTLTLTLTVEEFKQRTGGKSIFKVTKKRMITVPGSGQPCLVH